MQIQDLTWELHKPIGSTRKEKEPLWLIKMRTLRGEVLYENGLRPHFILPDGSFSDPDPIDLLSYHILAKINGDIIGTIRLTVLNKELYCASQEILGGQTFFRLLKKNNFSLQNLCEVGRWTVKKSFQTTRIGLWLAIAAIAMLEKLKIKAFAISGKKSCHLIKLFGGQLFPYNPGPYFVEAYNDDVFFIDLDYTNAKNKIRRLIPSFDSYL